MRTWTVRSRVPCAFLALFCGFLCLSPVRAQTDGPDVELPDAGDLMKEVDSEEPLSPALEEARIESEQSSVDSGPSLYVSRIEFAGDTVLGATTLRSHAAPYEGREVSFAELGEMMGRVADEYRARNHLARVYLPEQEIRDGMVRIEIVEARFGQLRIESADGVSESDRIRLEKILSSGQTSADPLDLGKLERAVLLANDFPGPTPKVVLSAGERMGFTDIVVVADAEAPFSGSILLDNFGSRSTGEIRSTLVGQAGNLFGRGEMLRANALISEGNRYGAIGFRLPIGYRGLKIGLNASMLNYELIADEYEVLDAEGEASTFDLDLSYPIILQPKHRLDARVRLGRRDYTNRVFGLTRSDKVITAGKLEVRGTRADGWLRGGQLTYGIDLTVGDVDLSGNSVYESVDLRGAHTAGQYATVGFQLGRVQRITSQDFVDVSLTGQWAGKSLDSSETFVLGGPSGVRAYPVLEASGDRGYRASVAWRRRLNEWFTGSVFVDHGYVGDDDSSGSTSLSGFGAGLNWRHEYAFASLTVARRFGSNPLRDPETGNDSDGSSRLWRVWAQVGMSF